MNCCFSEKVLYTLPELVCALKQILCRDYLAELVAVHSRLGSGFIFDKVLEAFVLELVADYYQHDKSLAHTHVCIEAWFQKLKE